MERLHARRQLRRKPARAHVTLFLLCTLAAIAGAPLQVESAVASSSRMSVLGAPPDFAKYDGRQSAATSSSIYPIVRRHEGHHEEDGDLVDDSAASASMQHGQGYNHGVGMGSKAGFMSTVRPHVGDDGIATTSSLTSSMPSSSVNSEAHHDDEELSKHPLRPASYSHLGADSHPHTHTHDTHGAHHHTHAHHPYDGVPDAAVAGTVFIAVPPLPPGAGGHSHGYGNEAPAVDLNETTILRGKGPDPLSYIEWDFGYGIGNSDELQRFAEAYNGDYHNVMGVAGGRWRTLLDEKDNATRRIVAQDIQARLQANFEDPGRHRTLMILHIVGCVISCFVLLPLALALRAAHSSLAPIASLVYLVTLASSLAASWMYKMMTPQLYPKHAHRGLGYAIFWLSLLALGADVFRLLVQLFNVVKGTRGSATSQRLSAALRTLSAAQSTAQDSYDPEEEERMLSDGDATSSDAHELAAPVAIRPLRQDRTSSGSWRDLARGHSGNHYPSPTSTLCNTPRGSVMGELHADAHPASWKDSRGQSPSVPAWKLDAIAHHQRSLIAKTRQRRRPLQIAKSVVRYAHVTLARSLPVLSFAAAYTGLAVYTGSCRGPYKNVCLAHGIKGGVFFWYGLLTFGRYMGAYADLGWAWNRRPGHKSGKHVISAEWVECLVILIYGATNTWMERFGAKAGDAYTVKQVQHISIAIMFWFAGLLGLSLETPSLKSLLSIPVAIKHSKLRGRARQSSQQQAGAKSVDVMVSDLTPPPSYSFSFNPFPALVIGVTGVAMAAHHQDYIYEVSIHALWGNLLAGFSVLRMLTYFFLWLRPPTSSIMPSRPPTEALASFSLACGGFVFMLSSEEVSFVAMRNGFGDMMMILNVTVALVSLIFCWIAGLMVIKAWAQRREHRRPTHHQEDGAIRIDSAPRTRGSDTTSAGVARAQTQKDDAVFVLEDDNDTARSNDEKRHFSSSPVQV